MLAAEIEMFQRIRLNLDWMITDTTYIWLEAQSYTSVRSQKRSLLSLLN